MAHAYTGDSMKIFTDTEKWDDQWFRALPPVVKLVYLYICDRSDHAGVWEYDEELLALHTKIKTIDKDTWLKHLKPKVIVLPNGKWWIVNYISFQNPRGISKSNKMCVPIYRSIEKNKIDHDIGVEVEPQGKDNIIYPYEEVLEHFHRLCPDLPKVQKLTPSRKRAIKSGYEDGIIFSNFFEIVSKSDFLCGRSTQKWKASFDWCLKLNNRTKILEGVYDGNASKNIGCHTDEEYNRESF
jgi:hypothetical protein